MASEIKVQIKIAFKLGIASDSFPVPTKCLVQDTAHTEGVRGIFAEWSKGTQSFQISHHSVCEI